MMVELWEGLIAGEESAYAKIYSYYFKSLYQYGYNLLQNRDLVTDSIQEIFVDIWRLRKNLSPTTSVKFYLFRSLKRKLFQKTKEENLYTFWNEEADKLSVQDPFGTQDFEMVIKSLSKLNPRYQEVLRLKFYEEFTWPEVAELLNINEQSARNVVQRAINQLKKIISENNFELK